jgi:hypothetical protein
MSASTALAFEYLVTLFWGQIRGSRGSAIRLLRIGCRGLFRRRQFGPCFAELFLFLGCLRLDTF